jgi:hypothetical protein
VRFQNQASSPQVLSLSSLINQAVPTDTSES